jgi:hypothetical protein
MQRVAAMRIELRVDRNGQTIFRAECDTERGSSFAEFSKLALREFSQRHPEVSLLDDGVWLKFDSVRCPEAPAHHDGPMSRADAEAPYSGAGIPSNARVSAIAGGSGLTDSSVRQRQRRWS